jgi:hypothetical protein
MKNVQILPVNGEVLVHLKNFESPDFAISPNVINCLMLIVWWRI